MINLNFAIDNPFSNQFKIVASTGGVFTENKAWEANVYRTANIVKFTLAYSVGQHHAGLRIEFGLFGYECDFQFYDTRHWNYETASWEVHGKSN